MPAFWQQFIINGVFILGIVQGVCYGDTPPINNPSTTIKINDQRRNLLFQNTKITKEIIKESLSLYIRYAAVPQLLLNHSKRVIISRQIKLFFSSACRSGGIG